MAASAIGYVASLLYYAGTAARSFRPHLLVSLTMAGGSFAACSLLVPRFGLAGAAWAMMLTMAVQLCGNLSVVIRALRCARASANR